MASTRHFGEEYRLPALGSEELKNLWHKLAQKLPKPGPASPVRPAVANPARTANRAAAFSSSGSARTDLFFKCEDNMSRGHIARIIMAGQDCDQEDIRGELEQLLSQVCCIVDSSCASLTMLPRHESMQDLPYIVASIYTHKLKSVKSTYLCYLQGHVYGCKA